MGNTNFERRLRTKLAGVLCSTAFAFTCAPVHAATIFESATLGPTGVTWEQLSNQDVPGVNVSDVVFNGVRFHLEKRVITSDVGGHFVGPPSTDDSFFGAIIQLDGENDFPDSEDLNSPDVLGATVLNFPEPSNGMYGELVVDLSPGWYALVFGSGLFETDGRGGAPLNNADIDHPSYIGFQPGFGWNNQSAIFDGKRFVVLGNIVPESKSMLLVFFLGAGIVALQIAKRHVLLMRFKPKLWIARTPRVFRMIRATAPLCATITTFIAAPGLAATVFESGTLGPTGVAWGDLESGAVPGTNIRDVAFNGVRFELTKDVVTSTVGGHFVAPEYTEPEDGTFFAAIVQLTGKFDYPDSEDLTSPDVLGSTLLTFPVSSEEVHGKLVLSLSRGWYALVFGSGLFGATTNGGAVRNGMDIDDPAYISFQPGFRWRDLPPFFDNHRFVVNGQIVPEPTSIMLSAITLLGVFIAIWRR